MADPSLSSLSDPSTSVLLTPTDIPTYISEQIPLLTSLHTQLALPPTALATDLARIDAAVRAAITSVVRGREDEVGEWETMVGEGKKALAGLAKALGEKGRSVVAMARRESSEHEPLPTQHARLIKQTEELEKFYDERLSKVEDLLATVERLAVLLGPPFDPPKPLEAIPGSSALPRSIPTQSRLSTASVSAQTAHTAPTINKRHSGRAGGQSGQAESDVGQTRTEWFDVGEAVVEELEQAMERALSERDVRLRNLETSFNDLIWYHAELDLAPFGSSRSHAFPTHLVPSSELEERPGDHARYESLLGEIMAVNLVPTEEDAEGVEIQGMEGVEPEMGLISWTETLLELWMNEKNERDARIQELYEKIEPLWSRLDIPQETIDQFIESNRGSGEMTIRAYEEELERVLEIRRTSLSSFVVGVRKEIAALQDSLMMGDDEKGEFGAFINDDFSEELLKEHEDEAERLRLEVELKSTFLPRVKEWLSLKEDEEELERSATDPNRFKKRGTAMLKEEKMRKRVEKLKPKIEAELLESLPAWEEENGRIFTARGERVVDTINDAVAAKEAAKEAKRLAKLGLAPAPAAKHATPAPASRGTAGLGLGGPGTTVSRKRDAPTPATAGGAGGIAKRARVASASAASTKVPHSAAKPRVVSASTFGYASSSTMTMMHPPSTVSRQSGVGGRMALPSPMMNTPTPIGFGSASGSGSGMGSASGISRGRLVAAGQPSLSVFGSSSRANLPPAGKTNGLAKVAATGSKKTSSRRQSFKPRQSVAGGLLMARAAVMDDGVVEEDEDVF